jgi:hypothetical protein
MQMDLLSLTLAVTMTAPGQLPFGASTSPFGVVPDSTGSLVAGFSGTMTSTPTFAQIFYQESFPTSVMGNPIATALTETTNSPANATPLDTSTSLPTDASGNPLTNTLTRPNRRPFESDHDFDGFINPVSNPVLAKDPRSSTWARVLFVNDNFPGSFAGGGDAQAYAMQVNIALTDRLTFIADKDGYTQLATHQLARTQGWLDLAAGLKYTIIRDVENQCLFTAGLMYEAPSGAAQVFQNQGSGIMTPFVTYGKEFCEHWHFMGTSGFSFGLDPNENSSFFYHSLHLDREIGGWFYPLLEMNWFQYTGGGTTLPRSLGEGDGLFNFGTQGMTGRELLTTAIGAKFKLANNVWAGAAYEFPLSEYKGILNNRITVDLTIRY